MRNLEVFRDDFDKMIAELTIDKDRLKAKYRDLGVQVFQEELVALDIQGNESFALLKFEHILDLSEEDTTPYRDDFQESWDGTDTVESVEITTCARIRGMVDKCVITQNKDDILKELI